jgi:ribonuclease T
MSLDPELIEEPVVPEGAGPVAGRFRGFLPVIVDVETGGFNAATDALLEIAAVFVEPDPSGTWRPAETIVRHVQPFEGGRLEPAALEFNKIDPQHPFRRQIAVDEKEALKAVLGAVRERMRVHGCKRAVLVGHNAAFDLGFLNAAVERTRFKRNPFHPFSTFDTVTLAAVAYGQTVLSRAVQAAGLPWDEKEAHAARYDAERTADLFCAIVNGWHARHGNRN